MINFSYKILGETGVRLLSMLFTLLLARQIGGAQFGQYSSALAVASVFMIIVDLGTKHIVTREIARHPTQRTRIIGSANVLKVETALIAYLALYAAGRWSHWMPDEIRMINALGFVAISYTLAEHFSALLSGKEEMGWEAIQKFAARGCVIIFGLAALEAGKPLIMVVQAMAVGAVLSVFVGASFVNMRFGTWGIEYQTVWIKKLLQSSWPLFGSVLFWILYDNQDILMLNYFKTPNDQIGYFASAVKVLDVLKVFPVLLTSVFFPSLSRLALNTEAFIHKARTLLGFTVLSFPLLIGILYVEAPLVIRLLYGSGFVSAVPLLRILLPAFIGISLNHFALQLLIAKDRERQLLTGAAIACGSNLLMCFLLIPRFGTAGVCYALLASEFLYLVFQSRLVIKCVPHLLSSRVDL